MIEAEAILARMRQVFVEPKVVTGKPVWRQGNRPRKLVLVALAEGQTLNAELRISAMVDLPDEDMSFQLSSHSAKALSLRTSNASVKGSSQAIRPSLLPSHLQCDGFTGNHRDNGRPSDYRRETETVIARIADPIAGSPTT